MHKSRACVYLPYNEKMFDRDIFCIIKFSLKNFKKGLLKNGQRYYNNIDRNGHRR